MTRGTKIRYFSLAVFTALVVGVPVGLVSPGARARFWAWRMHSSDRETRAHARTKLLEIGRPRIDWVYPELVAGEVADRVEKREVRLLLAWPNAGWSEGASYVVQLLFGRLVFADDMQRTWFYSTESALPRDDALGDALRGADLIARRLLLEEVDKRGLGESRLLEVAVPERDPLSQPVIDEVRARLGSAR